MESLFASGRIVDAILALVVVEVALLVRVHRRTGRGPSPAALLPNVLAGVGLMLALRGALTSAGWPWIAACLAGALVAHVADLALRWRDADARRAFGGRADPGASVSATVPAAPGRSAARQRRSAA